jgi:hypothetical protein
MADKIITPRSFLRRNAPLAILVVLMARIAALALAGIFTLLLGAVR